MGDRGWGIWRVVSPWAAGEEGPWSLGLERAVADYRRSRGERMGCCWGRSYGTLASFTMALEDSWHPLLLLALLSVMLSFHHFPHQPPYTSRHRRSATAKILLLHHILPGGENKLQMYCQHSVVSKHSCYKKSFIYICPSLFFSFE